jgi:hypothetical protein
MTRIRLVGLALVAVCAISVTTAASAGANPLFLSTALGKLLAKALATQKFVTHAGTVECTTLTANGSVKSLASATQLAIISYAGCKAFGLAATVSPAEYEFNANGTVLVRKPITIKATGCLVTVPAHQTLGPVQYLNKPAGEIEIEPNVTGITSSGSGVACEYEIESKGTYIGNSLVAVEGGKLSWEA